jgi:hypothetical protein
MIDRAHRRRGYGLLLWVVGSFLVADAGPSQITTQFSEYEVYEGLYKKTGYGISLPAPK